jgi:hypothetical protein
MASMLDTTNANIAIGRGPLSNYIGINGPSLHDREVAPEVGEAVRPPNSVELVSPRVMWPVRGARGGIHSKVVNSKRRP